jgi:hypothetical protein
MAPSVLLVLLCVLARLLGLTACTEQQQTALGVKLQGCGGRCIPVQRILSDQT